MYKPATTRHTNLMTAVGYQVDVLHCALEIVESWGEPPLRGTFWRCYLPIAIEGEASVRSARRSWPLQVGEAMVIPPDCPVTGHAPDPFTLHYAHFSSSLRLTDAAPLSFRPDSAIRAALDAAVERDDKPLFRAAILQLVTAAIASIPSASIRSPLRDSRVARAYDIMNRHLSTKLKNADIARPLGMSETSLLRLFRETVGASPQREHLRLRLNHAAYLLRHTDNSIEEIADECGFWDRNHFTRIFSREWKTSPAKYRSSPISP